MAPRQDSVSTNTDGEHEGGESVTSADIDGKTDNEDEQFNSVLDISDDRLSEVTIIVEPLEEKESEAKGSAFDPTQFFTQLGTVVAVFGVTMDMVMKVISNISAQNFTGVLANGLVLGLIHIPTLCALLYVLCKDKVKLAVKGAVYVSKMFVKKKKSQAERGAKTLVKKSDPRKLAARLQNKGKGYREPSNKKEGSNNDAIEDGCEIQSIRGNSETRDVVKVSNATETHYESSVERDSITWSDSERTITPSQSYSNINHHFEQRIDSDVHGKRHYRSKEDQYYDTRHYNISNENSISSESYQSFMETPRPGAKQHDLHGDGKRDSRDVMSDRTSRKYFNKEESTSVTNGYPSNRTNVSQSKSGFVKSRESLNSSASRISLEHTKRSGHFVDRDLTPSSVSTNLTNRRNGDFKNSDSLCSVSNKHPSNRHSDYNEGYKTRRSKKNDMIDNYQELVEPDREGSSQSRENKMGHSSVSGLSSAGEKRLIRKGRNERSRAISKDRKFGEENVGFRYDEEEFSEYSLDNESGKWITTETFNGAGNGRHDTMITQDNVNNIERKDGSDVVRNDVYRPRMKSKRNKSYDRQHRSSSSSRHRVDSVHNHQSTDFPQTKRNDEARVNGYAASRRSRPKVKSIEREQIRTRAEMPVHKPLSKSPSNQNNFELESDEEKILQMIRQIKDGTARKERSHTEATSKKQQKEEEQQQQRQQHHRSTSKEPRNKSKTSHSEGSTVVEIEDRGRKHGRRKR